MRPPGGAGGFRGGDSRLLEIVQSQGMRVVMWSVDSKDTTSVQNGDILLFHFKQNDVEALPLIIENLQNRGFILTTLSGLLEN